MWCQDFLLHASFERSLLDERDCSKKKSYTYIWSECTYLIGFTLHLKTFSLMSITFFPFNYFISCCSSRFVNNTKSEMNLTLYTFELTWSMRKIEKFHMQIPGKKKNVEKQDVKNGTALINAKRLYILSSTSYTIDIHWICFYFRIATLHFTRICLKDKTFHAKKNNG